jgi:hypothetical protein
MVLFLQFLDQQLLMQAVVVVVATTWVAVAAGKALVAQAVLAVAVLVEQLVLVEQQIQVAAVEVRMVLLVQLWAAQADQVLSFFATPAPFNISLVAQ